MLHYGILNYVLPLEADASLKLKQLDGMTAGNVDRPVVDEQCGRDGASNLVHPICKTPVEHLKDKREAVEGGGDPVVGKAGGVPGLEEAERRVASMGGGCDGGGEEKGVSTRYSGQGTAVEDYTSREERDDNKGFYYEAKDRCLRIQITIIRKRLNEGRSSAHGWRRLDWDEGEVPWSLRRVGYKRAIFKSGWQWFRLLLSGNPGREPVYSMIACVTSSFDFFV